MSRTENQLVIDPVLIRKYGGNGPRYTSYPTADRFVEAFDATAYRQWLGKRDIGGFARPLALYVHLPFCDTICFYCGCNKIVTKDHGRTAKYLKYVAREIALVSQVLEGGRRVGQMHWGGGTPTFLNDAELRELVKIISHDFELDPEGEHSIEVDPRKVSAETVALLGELGLNRISIGVQDFDPEVQRAVNRIQSVAETRLVIDAARANGFKSVNLDLIYGLPRQTPASFSTTLDQVLDCDPDRIALYSYAHLPTVFMPQRRIVEAELPEAETRLQLMAMAIERFAAAGYVYIGMDHFAKYGDDLAVAQRGGRLHRNFQGYSTYADSDLVGLGVSAISMIGPTYCQSAKSLEEYYDCLDRGVLPVKRGIELTADDLLRRAVIQALSCHFDVSMEAIGIAHLIDFRSYFATELRQLEAYAADGLVEINGDWIHVTPRGRLLVRTLCMVFDKYLRQTSERQRYSRVI